jgi:delta8-fatty-acid desaturase
MTKSLFSDVEIQAKVAQGRLVIIYDRKVYDLTKWKQYHPGGELALVHMNGKDATDAMIALHPPYVFDRLKPFYIGEYRQENFHNDKVSKDFRELNDKLWELGYYNTTAWFYIVENLKFISMLLIVGYLVIYQQSDFGYVAAALILGALWHQVAFVAHDSIWLLM